MSSIGARSAEIYVMRKRQKEKMKRMEEERVGDAQERKLGTSSTNPIVGKSKKVHPGGEEGATTPINANPS
ncbi:hypothetical protein L6164_025111 [Bauhinia variegata]|uniref:Uncharacterized protein n=1 Tax=Bauhinia variegata TaxID=167791 RepID=A0ACB9M241_BAUVA|nr:hypothetical protein L6164_025111 [Bauhinia variegata]